VKLVLRGFTIAEMLVASALILVLLGVMSTLILSTSRIGRESLMRASAQQSLAMAGRVLETDLDTSHASGVTLGEAGHLLAIHPMGQVTPGGALTWEDRMILYRYDSVTRSLYRKESLSPAADFPPTVVDGRPVRLSPDILAVIPPGYAQSGRCLLRDAVVSFENPAGVVLPQIGDPLTIRLEISQTLRPERPPMVLRLIRVHAFRNRGN
jgi:prepilin-type N-terminal cleavage/methylation domain-containing protein